jgi:RNA polymerase sigma factor (sigma-70 family)
MNTATKGRVSRRLATATCVALMAATVGGNAEAQTVQQLERYLTTSWRNAQIAEQDWSDCTQQAMTELLERVPQPRFTQIFDRPDVDDRRELNRAVWRTVQRWRRRRKCSPLQADTHAATHGAASPSDMLQRREIQEQLDQALANLSYRQQQILRLWSQGHTVAEISEQLQMPAPRVSDEKYKAIRKLRQMLDRDTAGELA